MKIKNASHLSLGAAPWKFLLLAVALLFTYALPVHADDHEAPAEEAPAEEAPTEEAPAEKKEPKNKEDK